MKNTTLDTIKENYKNKNAWEGIHPANMQSTILDMLDEIERLTRVNDGFERVIVNQKQLLFEKETELSRLRNELHHHHSQD
jgi:hypothetical protein